MTRNRPSPPFGYRLAGGVGLREKNDRIILILKFPLKAISLHPAWKEVVRSLAGRDFTPLHRILPLVENLDAQRVALMLEDLALKGFLAQQGVPDLARFPLTTIIIPVHNRPGEIEECLNSLKKLDYPADQLETIVVDDASNDRTPETVSRFPVRLIRLKKNRQAPFCRNLAAQEAAGEILAFMDSDCLAHPRWLKDLLPAFANPSVGAVGGRVDAYFNRSGLDRYEAVNSSLIMGRHAMRSKEKDVSFYVPSCNLLVRRDLFLIMGGFREALVVGEDVDLCWRMQDRGVHVDFQPVGRIFHKHRNRLIPFCKRRFDYGTSEPLLQKLHPKRGKRMVFPAAASLFLTTGILAVTGALPAFLIPCGLTALGDAFFKWRAMGKKGVPVGGIAVLMAVLRGYLAFGYHLCAFASRYYLIWAILLCPLFHTVSMSIFSMHLITGMVDFVVKKPKLNPFSFLFYFTLEQISYQWGVWWACFKHRVFGSVNPRLVRRSSSGKS